MFFILSKSIKGFVLMINKFSDSSKIKNIFNMLTLTYKLLIAKI